ncbi:hypothetical protein [Metalysinibacillus jejuensis]|uniref:hypothetical protein n=1 Tax=Metalysinibacillus jejuensis TaxID=914327 RepID=UPI000D3BAE70|nr:hypothetical protein [Metalysinibacillus jejuensis]
MNVIGFTCLVSASPAITAPVSVTFPPNSILSIEEAALTFTEIEAVLEPTYATISCVPTAALALNAKPVTTSLDEASLYSPLASVV